MQTFVNLGATLVFLSMTNIANAGLFGPSTYEDCVLEGLKNAKTDKALYAIYAMCEKKFPSAENKALDTQSQTLGEFEKRKKAQKKCKMSMEDDVSGNIVFSGEERTKVREAISALKSIQFTSDSLKFQNNSKVNIKWISIGILEKGRTSCTWNPENYAAVLACGKRFDDLGVPRGSYGKLPCDPQMKNFPNHQICLIGIGLGFASRSGLALEADKAGWCE